MRTGDRVLILVDEVLRHVLGHELVGLLWHPGVDEGSEVEEWRTVEGELIMDELVSSLSVGTL